MATQDPATIFYHHNGVVVTDRWLAVGGHRYDVVQLKNVVQTRGSLHAGATVALVIAVAEVVFFIPVGGLAGEPVDVLAGIVVLMIPCTVVAVCIQRWPARMHLLADYAGVKCVLFSTRNKREFGQVARALLRALEAATPDRDFGGRLVPRHQPATNLSIRLSGSGSERDGQETSPRHAPVS